jgi:PAS domain S-box-containing protein
MVIYLQKYCRVSLFWHSNYFAIFLKKKRIHMPLKKSGTRKVVRSKPPRRPVKKKKSASPKGAARVSGKVSKALQDRQLNLKLALKAVHVGIWELNLKTNRVTWSDHVYELFGLKPSSFNGTMANYLNLVHPDDRDKMVAAITNSVDHQKDFFCQHRVIWPDGSHHWIESTARIILDKKGNPFKMTGSVHDITSVKLRDLEKEDWKMRYEMIAASTGQVIYDCDVQTSTIIWCGHVADVIGYSAEEIGDVHTWVNFIHPDDRQEALQELEKAKSELRTYRIRYRLRKKNGDYIYLHDSGFFLVTGPGNTCRMMGSLQDISDHVKSEQTILQNNRFLESIENTMPGVLYVFDLKDHRNVYANPNIANMLGYTPEEVKALGPNFMTRIIHPEDVQNLPTWSSEPDGVVREAHYRMRTKEGQWRWFASRDTVFQRDSQQHVAQIIGIAEDITERKLADELLLEREKSYRELFDTVSEAIYIQDPDGVFVDVNKGACEMYGYDKAEFIGRTLKFLSAEGRNDLQALREMTALAMQGEPQSFEWWSKRKNGEVFLKEVRLTKGSYFGKEIIIATARDVTRQRESVEALRESEQRFRTLQQASFGGIGLHDQGIIIDCNQGLCDLTGYTYKELVGKNGLELIAPEWRTLVMEKIRTNDEQPYDAQGLRKDGSLFFLEIHGKSVPYQGRRIRVTEFRDITERKKSEEKILEQNARLLSITEDLKRKNDQLEEFTQIVSHNLRAPVGNILTLLNFLETSALPKERDEYINHLKSSGKRMLTTLHELTDVLQVKQDQNIEKQELRFDQVFRHVKSMLSAKITEAGADVQANFTEAPVIYYPHIYMESVLLNLLSNALKYIHPARKPVIRFRTYRIQNCILMEVSDNGLGIDLNRYGHQIFKLRKTFHRHPESRGVGLFMIKNQLEAMGGEISISSIENEGTTFLVNFNRDQTHAE